jgi:hypothetical protein
MEAAMRSLLTVAMAGLLLVGACGGGNKNVKKDQPAQQDMTEEHHYPPAQ